MNVDIGVPREVKAGERRVALTPAGVQTLVQRGHRTWVETGAGSHAGYLDGDYQAAGATIAYARPEILARAHLLVGVYPPAPGEYGALQPAQVSFAFWALPAARADDVRVLLERQVTAVGFEAIEDDRGHEPVVTALSEVTGSLALTIGSGLLLNEFGGRGILLGGCPGVAPAEIVVLGGGVLGRSFARAAIGAGAHVVLLDNTLDQLREAHHLFGGSVTTLLATRPNIEKTIAFADLVLGAAAVHGARTPILVTRAMLQQMKPGSLVMDLAIDMGGCFETSRPTAFPEPVYEVDGMRHFCVPNLLSVAARSSSASLTNAILPYVQAVADHGFEEAWTAHPELRRGTYVHAGNCTHRDLALALHTRCEPLTPSVPREV